jgi:hypothetical protein
MMHWRRHRSTGNKTLVYGSVPPVVSQARPERSDGLATFAFESNGRVLTEQDIADMPWSDERKQREAKRYHDLWDGFTSGAHLVEDDTERGFHWEAET